VPQSSKPATDWTLTATTPSGNFHSESFAKENEAVARAEVLLKADYTNVSVVKSELPGRPNA
jgi:hypothetical protein